MSKKEDKQEPKYPVRSLHEFLSELDKEWDRFRTGSLIGVVVSCVLLLASFLRMLADIRNRAVLDFVFMIVIIGALVYTVSALLAQHNFFKRWERRMGLLLHLEDKILTEELGNEE